MPGMLNPEEAIGRWISVIFRFGHAHIARELAHLGIGPGQHPFLFALLHQDGINQDELARRLHMDKGTTARALRRLEESGYVERVRDEEDRRSNRLFVTRRGRAAGEDVAAVLHALHASMLEGFSEAEHRTLLGLLKRVAQNAVRFHDQQGVKA